MNSRVYGLVSGVVFLLIALGHLLRVIRQGSLMVEGWAVPQWASAAAVVVTAYLGFEGLREWRAGGGAK